MAKYKGLIVGARIVSAGRKRKCYHSAKHKVQKGDVCLEVREGMAWKGYCAECGLAMISVANNTLLTLETDLQAKLES